MVPDLAGLLRALTESDVRFVVIGGIAVAAHRVVRATEDVDIVPDPDPANIQRLIDLLERLEARLLRNPEGGIDDEVRSGLLSGRNVTVTTSRGDLDIVQRLPGVPAFADLDADAWSADIFGSSFRVCSLAHLIAMKRARGKAIDLADLERLEG